MSFVILPETYTHEQMDASTHRGSISRSYGKNYHYFFFYVQYICVFLLHNISLLSQAELVEIWRTD